MDKYHDFKFFLISLFLALPGRCYAGFPSCGEWGLLFVAVHRLLSAGASRCRAQALGRVGSVVAVPGL